MIQTKVSFLLGLLILCGNGFCQKINFTKISKTISKDGLYEYIYRVEVYNNTNKPMCIPVSLSFGLAVNLDDTVEVANIYPARDSGLFFSLYYAKSDIGGSSARYAATPVIVNPNTYLLVKIRFVKAEEKQMFLELKYSYDKDLDYNKIRASFENEPRYKWMDDLDFVDKIYSINER